MPHWNIPSLLAASSFITAACQWTDGAMCVDAHIGWDSVPRLTLPGRGQGLLTRSSHGVKRNIQGKKGCHLYKLGTQSGGFHPAWQDEPPPDHIPVTMSSSYIDRHSRISILLRNKIRRRPKVWQIYRRPNNTAWSAHLLQINIKYTKAKWQLYRRPTIQNGQPTFADQITIQYAISIIQIYSSLVTSTSQSTLKKL